MTGPSCGKAPMDVRLKAIRRRLARILPWRKPAPEPPKVSRSELWSRVHDVLVKEMQVASSAISPQADFVKDLGLDSLDLIELTMALEEEFGMEIQDEEAQKIVAIPQLLELLEEKMAHVDRSDR